MHVFLSWAGEPSKRLASALRDFLPVVVQECLPWMSAHDILAGQPWDPELESALKTATFCVICITPQNRQNAYLHYEAGAIANQVGSQNRVCPILLGGLTAPQLGQPLGRFQGKTATEEGVWELVQSLNSIATKPLLPTHLRRAFDGQWKALERLISEIALDEEAPPRRASEELLDEILQHVRIFATTALGDRGAGVESALDPATFVSRSPEGQTRRYANDLVARIYRNLLGKFEWSVEDVKNKVVIDDGEATTLPEAQRQADTAASTTPLDDWHLMKRTAVRRREPR
jgi:hypothetical protein